MTVRYRPSPDLPFVYIEVDDERHDPQKLIDFVDAHMRTNRTPAAAQQSVPLRKRGRA